MVTFVIGGGINNFGNAPNFNDLNFTGDTVPRDQFNLHSAPTPVVHPNQNPFIGGNVGDADFGTNPEGGIVPEGNRIPEVQHTGTLTIGGQPPSLVEDPASIEIQRSFAHGHDGAPIEVADQPQTHLNMAGFNPEEYTPAPPVVAPHNPHDGVLNVRPATSLPAEPLEGEGWTETGQPLEHVWPADDVRFTINPDDFGGGSFRTRITPEGDVIYMAGARQGQRDGNASFDIGAELGFDIGEGFGYVEISHSDPNWSGASQRVSGGVEFPLGNGNIGFTAGTNLDNHAIQTGAYIRGNHDESTTFRVNVNTSDPAIFGGNPNLSGDLTIRNEDPGNVGLRFFGSYSNDRGLSGGAMTLIRF